jgi:CO dehydrogenase maturation factor
MRIAFVGKGGSGKTTLASAFARVLAMQGHAVLVIDADINQHLAYTLGIPSSASNSLEALGNGMAKLKRVVRGTNPLISDAGSMLKTTPPGAGSTILRIGDSSSLWQDFSIVHEGIRFMAAGELEASDIGTTCYHAKTGAVELLLNHLGDTKNEYIVVDMTAGADAFASGFFTLFDLTCIVVEPTLASILVYRQYRDRALEFGVTLAVLSNKIQSAEDIAFIEEHVDVGLVGNISESQFVHRSKQGASFPIEELEQDNYIAVLDLKNRLDEQTRDWTKYLEHVHYFHEKNCVEWANAQAGTDLRAQIDKDFAYPTT